MHRCGISRDQLVYSSIQYTPSVRTRFADDYDDLHAPDEAEGLVPQTTEMKRRARKISGISGADLVETEKKPKRQYSKRFEDNNTSEKLQMFMESGAMKKQFPDQAKCLKKNEELQHKLDGLDSDPTTIAYQEKQNRSKLHQSSLLLMQKSELPRCQANKMSDKFNQVLDLVDYIEEQHDKLHQSGSDKELSAFFEDFQHLAACVEAIKGVYCDIPQQKYIAQEMINCLRAHYNTLGTTNDPFARRTSTTSSHSSRASVAPSLRSAIGGQSGFAGGTITGIFARPRNSHDSDDDES